jgi:hypothetical protein
VHKIIFWENDKKNRNKQRSSPAGHEAENLKFNAASQNFNAGDFSKKAFCTASNP